MTVAEALAEYRTAHGVARDSRWLWVPLGPVAFVVPSPGTLEPHDRHHIALGCAPDVWGEIAVSALELRGGGGNRLVVALCVAGLALGVFIAPRFTYACWQRAAGCQTLYGTDWARFDDQPVSVLRDALGVGTRS